MRTPFVVGNWKLHKTIAESLALVTELKNQLGTLRDVEVGVAPPFTALHAVAGWHPQDPFSVPAALEGPPVPKRAALVTEMPFSKLPAATIAAIGEKKTTNISHRTAFRPRQWTSMPRKTRNATPAIRKMYTHTPNTAPPKVPLPAMSDASNRKASKRESMDTAKDHWVFFNNAATREFSMLVPEVRVFPRRMRSVAS